MGGSCFALRQLPVKIMGLPSPPEQRWTARVMTSKKPPPIKGKNLHSTGCPGRILDSFRPPLIPLVPSNEFP